MTAISESAESQEQYILLDKNITISINLSAYDINSKTFRRRIYIKLEGLEDASNFIFEFLEDEEFRDLSVLQKFISRGRNYNVQIAIEDFGSGYSNLLEIAKISPEYIKVDGRIIKDIPTDEHHQMILDTIIYLAEKINTTIIAEYVENEAIYSCIAATSIGYSQGYYFSIPAPLAALDLEEEFSVV